MKKLPHTLSEKGLILVIFGVFIFIYAIIIIADAREQSAVDMGVWEIGFSYPRVSDSLDFFVKNADERQLFFYTVSQKGENRISGEVRVNTGESFVVEVDENLVGGGYREIEVQDESGEKRVIYRKDF